PDLKIQMIRLFEIREDATKQYPSLAVGNNVMQPNRNEFNNAIALALNELREEGLQRKQPKLYAEFIQARHLWTQVLSNFRLYLANRVGSFNEESLPIQEKAIETMYDELRMQLKQLERFDKQGKLGFQASESLANMLRTGENWYQGFLLVKEIHHAEDWRVDSKIMREEIVPLINRISEVLSELETDLNEVSARDVNTLLDSIRTLSGALLWSAASLLLLLLIIYISTERMVFRPIATLVRALKAQGEGQERVVLPSVRSRETEELMDSFREMSRRIQHRQNDLEYQALHDALTSLPNRTLLHERMEHQLQLAKREESSLSLLIIDLDQFKDINDTLGHHIGDQILVDVGARFTTVLREIDTVARLGGDEFAIMLPDADEEAATAVCKKLQEVVEDVFTVNQVQLYVGMSIGVACYPQHGEDVTSLIQHADVAMYDAKHNKLGCAVYNVEADKYSITRLGLINDLRDAIENDKLELYYQSLVNAVSGDTVGVEALLRWQHPVQGSLSPVEVVELAEHTGLINPLTYWVVDKAMQQGQSIFGDSSQFISINISVYNLKDPEFVQRIRDIQAKHYMSTTHLMFEITESAMMANPVHATRTLIQLDNMGIKLAIDDFGTGFSSLAYLKQLPVDELKIDKSFVMGMQYNISDEVIVRSTIELAHNLGLKVIAEGVENNEIVERLREFGCDTLQGYFYSRPQPLRELQEWLGNTKPRAK
ncbi:MAG: sensor domain-containing phosphodiesterase, partial [Gammaproteobacteria bacterium]|nr:sensor domain-containing phosphodiesterase [Gammaproteobacteria bacterium]